MTRVVNGASPSGRSRNPCAVPSGAHRLSGVSRGRVDEGVANLDVCLREAQKSPADDGIVELIVRRPAVDERELLDEATLALDIGIVGDTWSVRSSPSTADGSPHPDAQVTLMNARVIAHLAQTPERWALAGDQLYLDLDLSYDNLPPGTQLALGSAVIEVTAKPHTGCFKFRDRFGAEALRIVNSPAGKVQRLRGVNARIVRAGTVRRGDRVRKLAAGSTES